MPIYTYECPKCKHVFERFTPSFKDVVSFVCPKCGKWTGNKVPSVPGKPVVK